MTPLRVRAVERGPCHLVKVHHRQSCGICPSHIFHGFVSTPLPVPGAAIRFRYRAVDVGVLIGLDGISPARVAAGATSRSEVQFH